MEGRLGGGEGVEEVVYLFIVNLDKGGLEGEGHRRPTTTATLGVIIIITTTTTSTTTTSTTTTTTTTITIAIMVMIMVGTGHAATAISALFLYPLEHVGQRARDQPVRLRVFVVVPVLAHLHPALVGLLMCLLLVQLQPADRLLFPTAHGVGLA